MTKYRRRKWLAAAALFCCAIFVLSSCISLRSANVEPVRGDGKRVVAARETYETPASADTEKTPSETTAPAETKATPQTTAELPPEPEPPKVISFLAAGDNVIHPCIYLEAKQRATADTRAYHFKPMYHDVIDLIAGYDIAFINQETLMGGEELGYSGYPRFNSPQELGLDLVEMGFDIVNIANNHMCDQWEKGLRGTIDFWRTQPVTLIGDYLSREEYEIPDIIERDGVSIALLSYTYGTNGLSLPASSELIVPYLNDADILRHISIAQEEADLVFVSVHWGEENLFQPTAEQKRLAQLMADAGVDAVIGHHPHVLQPIEWIEGENGNRMLCAYSLGNLVSAMMESANMVGGFLTFDIIAESGEAPYIDNVLFLPTVFFYGMNYYSTHLYLMEDFTDTQAAKHGTQIYGNYASAARMRQYVTDAIEAQFLPKYITNP